jgi:2-polyprenyl-3-methyl-5-hydroxy-6-metoxy-1,4-benzoquinol methylase
MRSDRKEILDGTTPAQPVVDEIYRYLVGVNRWLGGHRASIARFGAFARGWPPGSRIDVLDVACGAGDTARALVAWGRARGIDLSVTATDVSLPALDYARRTGTRDARLRFVCDDVRQPAWRDRAFDYVTCGLFFHHLTDEEILAALASFDRLARRGIVVNDLRRSWRAWLWSWLITWPFHPILHHDGPLSVRRALTPGELGALAERAGLPWLSVARHFGHRMTLAGERPR